MNWLSRVRNGIQSLTKRQSADNLWHKCGKCQSMVFTKEWEDNGYVCPRCDHHDRIGPAIRFNALFDRQKYEVLDSPEVKDDPLKFRDAAPTDPARRISRIRIALIAGVAIAAGWMLLRMFVI